MRDPHWTKVLGEALVEPWGEAAAGRAVEHLVSLLRWPTGLPQRGAALALAWLTRFGHSDAAAVRARLAHWRGHRSLWRQGAARLVDGAAAIAAYPDPALDEDRAYPLQEQFPGRHWDVVVIGSGPGGAITAYELARSGRRIAVFDEGAYNTVRGGVLSFHHARGTLRGGAPGAAFGNAGLAYLEARCLGGASEINSGLWVRPPDAVLARWNLGDLSSHFAAIEAELPVSHFSGQWPGAAEALRRAAADQGWQVNEVGKMRGPWPDGRWADGIDAERARMSKTYLPWAVAAGAEIIPGVGIKSLERDGAVWRLHAASVEGRSEHTADAVFVAGGTLQSPRVLRSSGLIGQRCLPVALQLIGEVIAEFDVSVNDEAMGLPPIQVGPGGDGLVFGCGVSSRARLAMGLAAQESSLRRLDSDWQRFAVFTVMQTPENTGQLTLSRSGYQLRFDQAEADRERLLDGMRRLGQGLKQAGARAVHPLTAAGRPRLSTVHLTSSLALAGLVDCNGALFGADKLFVSDASILPTAPASNPQAAIMAIARRNVRRFLAES